MKIPVYTCKLVRSATANYSARKRINCSSVACEVVKELSQSIMEDSPNEVFGIVTLDTKLKPIGFHIVTSGTLDASLVHPREVFRHAILANASAVLLVHNHPSGELEPSNEDRIVTDRLKQAGNLLGIQVIDHIVVGHDTDTGVFNAVSLAESA